MLDTASNRIAQLRKIADESLKMKDLFTELASSISINNNGEVVFHRLLKNFSLAALVS